MFKLPKFLALLATFFFLMIAFWSAYSYFALGNLQISQEDGFLENGQVFFLIAACILFLIPVFKRCTNGRLILLFCSWLCLNFVLREVDVENYDVPGWMIFIGSGMGRNLILLAGYVAIFMAASLKMKYYFGQSLRFLRSKEAFLLILGGVFLILGLVFEKYWDVPHHEFWEELMEFVGYFLIVLSSIASNFRRECEIPANPQH